MTKYILVTGGVISGVGKGIIASSTGFLLRSLGLTVTAIKIDPYLNIDAGTISPLDHGEVFVLDDGGEVDMDLGNYERFLNVTLTRDHNMTTGKIYRQVIEKERRGDYLGKTVQVVPHLTDEIQQWIEQVSKIPVSSAQFSSASPSASEPDVCIVELGGIVGDIESAPFVEAMRQFQFRVGHDNFCLIHVSLVPVVGSVGEQKTKPTQVSVRDLRGLGLSPDLIICRSTHTLEDGVKQKISMFCHVSPPQVLAVHDCPSLYHVPLLLESQGLTSILTKRLGLGSIALSSLSKSVFEDWCKLAKVIDAPAEKIDIALVGKYTYLSDSYISVVKALEHASLHLNMKLNLTLVEASNLELGTLECTPDVYENAWSILRSASGIMLPGGFGDRGTEGMILTCQYARENNVPFFGICLGFQIASVEFARNKLGLEGANSVETDEKTPHPIVIFMPEISKAHLGGTMRLGSRLSRFSAEDSKAKRLYSHHLSSDNIFYERHRHRYEINPQYITSLEKAGLEYVARDDSNVRMEILEYGYGHPYYVACQFHPEFKSRPLSPSPLFLGLLGAAQSRHKLAFANQNL